jgi:succinate dehydrogenase/fumarate reductase flavoprotein subunit
MLETADTDSGTRAQCDVLVIGGGPAGSTVSALLAGDIFRGTPVGLRLVVIKVLYYISSAAMLRKSLMAWRRRKQAIRESGDEAALVS